MTDEQRELLLKAQQSLEELPRLRHLPRLLQFYIAEAFLEGEELSFSKHSAVIAAFG